MKDQASNWLDKKYGTTQNKRIADNVERFGNYLTSPAYLLNDAIDYGYEKFNNQSARQSNNYDRWNDNTHQEQNIPQMKSYNNPFGNRLN